MKMAMAIHYRFMISSKETLLKMLKEVKDIAVKLGMKILQDTETCIVIHTHPDCEEDECLNLDFQRYADVKKKGKKNWDYEAESLKDFRVIWDDDFVCSSCTKTEHAGYKIHTLLAEILRKVASRCALAYVEDETGYYETRDIEKTTENFDDTSKVIGRIAGELKRDFRQG